MAGVRRRLLKILVVLLLATGLIAATRSLWLAALGRALVNASEPAPAEMVVVLAGDGFGNRILKGAELVRQGYAPRVLVSGSDGYYGVEECDLAIRFATKRGYPSEWFIPLPAHANSTQQEAGMVLAELRRRGIRRFMVVTSDYHTARAARVYRRLAQGMEFRVIAAPDRVFRPESWWQSRGGQKVMFFELSKTIGAFLGL